VAHSDLEKTLLYEIEDWGKFWELAEELDCKIIFSKYDMNGNFIATFNEIADELGVSSSEVVNRHRRCVRNLRHPSRKVLYAGRVLTVDERVV
jgi:predicted urease superfamily metal-dependent hydrolase